MLVWNLKLLLVFSQVSIVIMMDLAEQYEPHLNNSQMSRGEMKPEFTGEGAVHTSFRRVLSQVRFWIHTKKNKIGL